MPPLPLGFSQVLILNGVRVFCFDTLLQVFILKVLADARFASWAERSWGLFGCIRDTHPWAFFRKSLDLLDCEGVEFFRKRQSPEQCVRKGVSSAERVPEGYSLR